MGKSDPWLQLVNLGMIWGLGFFFLGLHDDLDEGSQQRYKTLLVLSRLREIVQRPDTPPMTCATGLNAGEILFLYASSFKNKDIDVISSGLVHR